MTDDATPPRPLLRMSAGSEPTEAELEAGRIAAGANRACEAGKCVTLGCKCPAFIERVQMLINKSVLADADRDFKGYEEVTVLRCKKNRTALQRSPRESAVNIAVLVASLVFVGSAINTDEGWAALTVSALGLSLVCFAAWFVIIAVLDHRRMFWRDGDSHRTSRTQTFMPSSEGRLFTYTRERKLISRGAVPEDHKEDRGQWHFCEIDQIPRHLRERVIMDLQR